MRFKIRCAVVRFVIITILTVTLVWRCLQVLDHSYAGIIKENDIPAKYIKNSSCEIIHVGIVCVGTTSIAYFHTMLKSLYFYRTSSLHFHIMVNAMSENILKTLFETWSVPQVTVSFYNVNNIISDVEWVPNTHYSGVYGLLKLTFPTIISSNVTNKIIILDTDLIFTDDISELWNFFYNFNKKQAVGLVENQSDFYLGLLGVKKPWPALGRGFNTGVMLFYLERLKINKWRKLWATVVRKTIMEFETVVLADQDVINAVIKHNSDLVYHLPCQWNVQLSLFTQSSNCYSSNKIKVLHWNTLDKFKLQREDWEEFRKIYTKFNQYDGSMLRRPLNNCLNFAENFTAKPLTDVCSKFRQTRTHQRRTLVFFREFNYAPTKNDVTFVTQLSYDKLEIVEELSNFWYGPISVTFYVTDAEFQECQNFIENSETLKERFDIAYHVVFKEGNSYPVTELQNIGLRNVFTPYVFLVDGDFLPTPDLYSTLMKHIDNMGGMEKKALVVPAFLTQEVDYNDFPANKDELLEMLDNFLVFPLKFRFWRTGHEPTNYTLWRTADAAYRVKWKPNFEPYVVVRKDVTRYNEQFSGFGWYKVAHIMELEAQGFYFLVLPNTFLIHKIKTSSSSMKNFRKSWNYKACLRVLRSQFLMYLRKRYGFQLKQRELNNSNER